MPRIAGIDVPNEKPVWISLTYIYGIGKYLSKQILKEAQISETIRAKELTDDEISRIAGIIDRNYVVEGQLRRQLGQDVARLRDIGCYRGLRHRRGLPGAMPVRERDPGRPSPERRVLRKCTHKHN